MNNGRRGLTFSAKANTSPATFGLVFYILGQRAFPKAVVIQTVLKGAIKNR